MGTVKKFLQHVVPGIIRPLHVLWNEIIGFLFIALALMAIRPAWRSYQGLEQDPDNLGRLVFTGLFGVVMLGFGIHSFWRARKIGRS